MRLRIWILCLLSVSLTGGTELVGKEPIDPIIPPGTTPQVHLAPVVRRPATTDSTKNNGLARNSGPEKKPGDTAGRKSVAKPLPGNSKPAPSARPLAWLEDLDQAIATAEQGKKPLLILLTTSGCRYCERMKAETLSHPQIANRLGQTFVPLRLDGKKHSELSRKFQVRVYPTIAVLSSDGEIMEIVHGFRTPAEFGRQLARWQSQVQPHLASRPRNL